MRRVSVLAFHVVDLAAALWALATSGVAGVFHLAGPDAVSRHDLGVRPGVLDAVRRESRRSGEHLVRVQVGPGYA